jgi:hypothetical protein
MIGGLAVAELLEVSAFLSGKIVEQTPQWMKHLVGDHYSLTVLVFGIFLGVVLSSLAKVAWRKLIGSQAFSTLVRKTIPPADLQRYLEEGAEGHPKPSEELHQRKGEGMKE